MPIPPPGSPFRPLHLASNAARLLGGVNLLIGLLAGCIGIVARAPLPLSGVAVVGFVVPGALYFVFTARLQEYKVWAAIVLLVMASVHGAVSLLAVAMSAITFVRALVFTDERNMASLALLVFLLVVLAACVSLIVNLCRSFTPLGMRAAALAQGSAFQPIMPVMPYLGPPHGDGDAPQPAPPQASDGGPPKDEG